MLWVATATAQSDRGIVPAVLHPNLLAVFSQGRQGLHREEGVSGMAAPEAPAEDWEQAAQHLENLQLGAAPAGPDGSPEQGDG